MSATATEATEMSDRGVSTGALSDELDRIMSAARQAGVLVRLYGGYGVRYRCPAYAPRLDELGRRYHDLDFVCAGQRVELLRRCFLDLGYSEDAATYVNSEGNRLVLYHQSLPMHVDVFVETPQFCHDIPMKERLEVDDLTVPMADLLLGKLQIVQINRKDLLDATVLLLEHDLGEQDGESINLRRLEQSCGRDWGLWRTVTLNLPKVAEFVAGEPGFSGEERTRASRQAAAITGALDSTPKTRGWKIRAKIGERVKWYRTVEELEP